jgi:uncharacterized delta-60 repeat protein
MKVSNEVMNIDGNDGCDFDEFYAVATDSSGNTICVGVIKTEGAGGDDALVVKYDTNLNVLARKIYGGINLDEFSGVVIDSNNNIICVGNTYSEDSGIDEALVVKFDPNLDIIAKKVYGGSGIDRFYEVVTDDNDNIICVGRTVSEGSGDYDALVVKFDNDLNILAKRIYDGAGNYRFYEVATDSNGNIICAGRTQTEGADSDVALVVKYDPNLDIIAKKIYDGSGADAFYTVATDSNDNIICIGWTVSEETDSDEALVVKFDTNLNILTKKIYDGIDWFNGVAIDSNDNIICVGRTASGSTSGTGNHDTLVVKFDPNLDIITKKLHNDAIIDRFYEVVTDDNDNIICVGRTVSEGSGSFDASVVKFDPNLNMLVNKIQ